MMYALFTLDLVQSRLSPDHLLERRICLQFVQVLADVEGRTTKKACPYQPLFIVLAKRFEKSNKCCPQVTAVHRHAGALFENAGSRNIDAGG